MEKYARNGISLLLAAWVLWSCGHISTAHAGTVYLQLENDSFDGASDAYYTQGLQFVYTPDTPVTWPNRLLSSFFNGRELRQQYFLGQAIFTPYEIGETRLLEYDRPYAGWLYLGTALLAEQLVPENRLKIVERFELSAGIVGPSSAADPMQRWTHQLLNTYDVNGWHNQLRDEPTLLAGYARKWAHIRSLGRAGLDWEMSATLGGTLGNVATQLISGCGLRLGKGLYSSVGVNGLQPATVAPHHGGQPGDSGWSLFADWQLRFVARDIFLDGNSYKDSHSVDKEPRVGEWRFGLALTTDRYQWTIYHARRSQEFEGQYENANFSGVSLAASF